MTAALSELFSLLNPQFSANLSGVALWIGLAALGFVIGTLTGLFGVGGGFITVPLMNVLFAIPYEIAVGSSLSMIIGASTAGTLTNLRQNTMNLRVAAFIALGSAVGSIGGDYLQSFLIDALEDGAIFTRTMHVLFLLLLALSAFFTLRRPRNALERVAGSTVGAQPQIGSVALVAIGLALGILTGLLGVGGGVLLIPILLTVVGLEAREAAGTSLGVVLVAAVIGTVKKSLDPVAKTSMAIVLSLLVASTVGVRVGNAIGRRVAGGRFRILYVGVLAIAAALIVTDLVRSAY